MAATQKALSFQRALVDNLNMRLADNGNGSNTTTASFDSSGDAVITVTVGTGNHSIKALVRLKPVAPLATQVDALGLAQRVLTPHTCQVLFDSNASGATEAQKAMVLFEAMKLGTKFELYLKDAVAVAVSDLTTTNLVKTLEDLPWRDISAQ